MKDPSETQVLKALAQSGYLFEQEVADRLETLGLHVDTGWAFRDPELDKSRELDIRAIRRIFHDEERKLSVFVELLIECKAFETPIVFLQRPKNSREIKHSTPKEYIFPVTHFRKWLDGGSYQEVSPFTHLDLQLNHYYYRDPLKATQFSKIVRKGSEWIANHEGVYDSLVLPLAKALEIQRADAMLRAKGPDWNYIWLFFPMVVLRNGLFALDVTQEPQELKVPGRVSFVRHLESGNVNGFYMIDFVTFEHLNSFIENELGEFSKSIIQLCQTTPNLFDQN